MNKLALIALIMVFGLSGCACCKGSMIKQSWIDFWHDPAGDNWRQMKQDLTEFWHDPGGENWELIKWSWTQWLHECPFP